MNLEMKVFPNPTVENITLEFDLPESKFMRLELIDVSGSLVKVLLEDRVKGGKNRLQFNAELLNSGTYFVVGKSSDKQLFSKQIVKH
jgi:hypothetical protein